MTCKKCHIEMSLVRYADHAGRDGSVSEKTYRCVRCWTEKVVTEPRKAKA